MEEARVISSSSTDDLDDTLYYEIRNEGGLLKTYYNNTLVDSTDIPLLENVRLVVDINKYNVENIIYIELP